MRQSRNVILAVAMFAQVLAVAGVANAENELWSIREGRSLIVLDQAALSKAGLLISSDVGRTTEPMLVEVAPHSPYAAVFDDLKSARFSTLQVFHLGGLSINSRNGRFDMTSILIDGSELALQSLQDKSLDQSPRLVISGGDRFVDVPSGSFGIQGGSLLISPALAAQLGQERLTGVSIGTVSMNLVFEVPNPAHDEPNGQRVCASPNTGPDVIVGGLEASGSAVQNYTAVGAIDAISIATSSCNIGNVNVQWVASNNNHPVIGGSLYRYNVVNGSGRFEQIGLGWLKHGFTALTQNLCCTCNGQGGSVLGQGCSDPYTASRNGQQLTTSGGLGPRFQVNAHTGVFTYPYLFRNLAIPGGETNISRRVQIKLTDLNPAVNAGAIYTIEGQYVTKDDATAGNQNNNASYAPATVTGNATDCSVTASNGTTVRQKSAVQRWKALDPSVTETLLDVPEDAPPATGRLILMAKATSLGGGIYHYEYALYNMNSERAVQSFSVPVSPYANVTNIEFHDVFYHDPDGCGSTTSVPITFDGTDWPGIVSGGNVRWDMVALTGSGANAPCNSNALRWGSTYNFRFDSDLPPGSGKAAIGQWTVVNSVDASTVIPDNNVTCLRGDMNNDGLIDAADISRFSEIIVNGAATPREKCAGDLEAIADFGVDLDDTDNFANCLLNGGGC
ncbi:MAG: hypothetical protein HZA51_00080 [Planctomycetes bacterium]|nr:hypothetical protein [Planctomycetota bacterium]